MSECFVECFFVQIVVEHITYIEYFIYSHIISNQARNSYVQVYGMLDPGFILKHLFPEIASIRS